MESVSAEVYFVRVHGVCCLSVWSVLFECVECGEGGKQSGCHSVSSTVRTVSRTGVPEH